MPTLTLSLPAALIQELKEVSALTGLSQSWIARMSLPLGIAKARGFSAQLDSSTATPSSSPVTVPVVDPAPTSTPVKDPAAHVGYSNPFNLVPQYRGRTTWFDLNLICKAFGIEKSLLTHVIDTGEDVQEYAGTEWIEIVGLKAAREHAPDPELADKVFTWCTVHMEANRVKALSR